ncbi:MAG: L-threonylcarbamoyladenylate synthase [Patescibacteria group bacterium]
MEILSLAAENTRQYAARAAVVLRAGGVVLYPTDTLYGLGADALSDEAVAKIFSIKGRNEGKPVHAIVRDIAMAEKYGEISDTTRALADKLPRGQITFVVPKKQTMNSGISKEIPTFGFRIPENAFCLQMLSAFGGPITATSANRAGMEPQRSVEAILEQLNSYASVLPARRSLGAGGQKTAIRNIALIIDAGELPPRKSSTVVEISGDCVSVLRESAVPRAEIEAVLSSIEGV